MSLSFVFGQKSLTSELLNFGYVVMLILLELGIMYMYTIYMMYISLFFFLTQGRYGLCRFLRDGYKTPREVLPDKIVKYSHYNYAITLFMQFTTCRCIPRIGSTGYMYFLVLSCSIFGCK